MPTGVYKRNPVFERKRIANARIATQTPEFRMKMSRVVKEWSDTPEARADRRKEMLNRHRENPSFHKKALLGLKKANEHREISDEQRKKMSLARLGKKLPPRSRQHCESISKMMRALWEDRRKNGEAETIAKKISRTVELRIKNDPKYRKMILESSLEGMSIAGTLRPNKPERELNTLLQRNFPKQFRMNVKGQVRIDGKIPDFVNVNGHKAVIEMFGSFWHPPSDESKRKKIFKKWGFETLVVWEAELKNSKRLVSKIKNFVDDLGGEKW